MTQNAKPIIINGSNITGIASFYGEVNRVFMQDEDWKIGESLDAFNDLLYGGFGIIAGSKTTDIVWHHTAHSQKALGFDATKQYYLAKLAPGSPFNTQHFGEKLTELESGTGQTYFDIIIEIISGHTNIKLIQQ